MTTAAPRQIQAHRTEAVLPQVSETPRTNPNDRDDSGGTPWGVGDTGECASTDRQDDEGATPSGRRHEGH